ncbi:prolipoprotein diacylglyceryl transferase [Zhengella mangrovi]|uniref:prolipoprotein diacylglyceryl transferase n=1 Tax=Zhengella mangrovi TaxID=1982044 RepID=UPI0013FD59F5|nr:prolipoprotein diacylglyceryl transferase [Zhengella mangrovi]
MPDILTLPLSLLSYPQIDPVIFSIGPLSVRWYGLGYVAGILFGWWYSRRLVQTPRLWAQGQPPMSPVDLDDLVVWAAIGIVAGGRIGYILFYDLQRYLAHPLDMLALWEGGMSFHGGMLGTTLAMILFARSRGIPVWSLFDVVAAGVPPALGLVRVANFINAELWGRPTDAAIGMIFPTDPLQVPRHPSQLYEAALEGVVLFAVLAILVWGPKMLRRQRFVSGTFVAGYGLARIAVEFFREPDPQLGYLLGTDWLTMGMVLSVPMVLAGAWAMTTARRPDATA